MLQIAVGHDQIGTAHPYEHRRGPGSYPQKTKIDQGSTVDGVIMCSVTTTAIMVGDNLLKQQAMLLPDIYATIDMEVTRLLNPRNISSGENILNIAPPPLSGFVVSFHPCLIFTWPTSVASRSMALLCSGVVVTWFMHWTLPLVSYDSSSEKVHSRGREQWESSQSQPRPHTCVWSLRSL